MFKKFPKILIGVVLGVFVFGQAGFVFAQIGEVPVSSPGLGQGGIPGSIAAGIAKGALKGTISANELCKKQEIISNGAESAGETATLGLSLIGANAVNIAKIEGTVKGLETSIKCREGVIKILKAVPVPNIFIGQDKQRLETDINKALVSLKERKTAAFNRLRIAKTSVWKAILTYVALNSSKKITKELVYRLNSRFRVLNFLDYANSVASNVYQVQLINKNNSDNKNKSILRGMLNDPNARNIISPAVALQANRALGFNPKEVKTDDVGFYLKMARSGASFANPNMVHIAMVDEAYQTEALARQSAVSEVSQGNGFKATRTCAGNLAEQSSIDNEYKQVKAQVVDRQRLFQDLQNFQNISGNKISEAEKIQLQADIAKAKADLDKANKQLVDQPQKYETTALTICKGIVSPASLIDSGINTAFGELGRGLGDLRADNLPFFMTFMADVATQLAGTAVFGGGSLGNTVASTLYSGGVDRAVGSGLAFAVNNNDIGNTEKDISFPTPQKSGNSPDEYILTWDASGVKNASYVTITGTGISPTTASNLSVSGSTAVKTSSSSSYMLRVYDSSGKQLETAITNIEVAESNSNSNSNDGPINFNNPPSGFALGARIGTPIKNIRGPSR